MVYRLLTLLLMLTGSLASFAASPFAGFYVGQMHTSISGNISMPERPTGPVAFTVTSEGFITSTGDLTGSVSDSGTITWNANSTGFTTGTIADGVISSSTSIDNNGTISHFRIEASNSGPGTGESNALAGRLEQVNPDESLRGMNRVRFTGDRFIAAGASGAFAYSFDGQHWTRIGVPTVLGLSDVAYGNGRYVVVGDSGARFWSTNGLDWVSNPGGTGPMAGVAFGNGIFASVGFNGGVSTSVDGLAWAPGGALGGGLVYSGIDFLNGEFIAWTGDRVAFSADASDWTVKTAPVGVGNITVSLDIHDKAAYGNGRYLIGGQTGLAYSTDGLTWTQAERAGGSFGHVRSVAFGNGLFVVCDIADELWISSNGLEWTRVDRIELDSVVFGNGLFVGVRERLWISRDAITWVAPEVDALRADRREPSYVDPYSESPVVGNYKKPFGVDYTFGHDGYITWFIHQNAGGSGVAPKLTSETLRSAVAGQITSPVIVGNRGTIIAADERLDVTFQLIPPITTSDLVHGAGSSDTIVVVGTGGTILYTQGLFRTNWLAANSGTTADLKHVAWYPEGVTTLPSMFVAVGANGTLLTSPDGASWTAKPTGLGLELVGSAYNAARKSIQAAASNGALFETTNGTDWVEIRSLPAATRLRYFRNNDPFLGDFGIAAGGDNGLQITLLPPASDVPQEGRFTMNSWTGSSTLSIQDATFGNGRFLVAGPRGAAVSTRGHDWTSRTNAYEIMAVAFGDHRFVALSQSGILVSDDGLRWRPAQNVPANSGSLNAITRGGGRFVAAGHNGTIFVSADGLSWSDKSISGSIRSYNDITWANGIFAAGGTSGRVAISTDGGESWTERATGMSEIRTLAFGNGLLVVAGLDGWSASSSNMVNWEARQYPYISPVEDRPDYQKLAFADGLFYASAREGDLYTSADGLTWKRNFTGVGSAFTGGIVANGAILFANGNEIYFLSVPDSGSPIITQNPAPTTTVNEDGSLTLTAAAAGSGLEYIWLKDGAPVKNSARVTGRVSNTLTISPMLPEDAGEYEFVAINQTSSRASAPAIVTVRPKPIIASHPRGMVIGTGGAAAFSVDARGEGTLTYRWFKNGEPIPNAASLTLELANLTLEDAGNYHVEVTNEVGVRASQHASLSVFAAGSGYSVDANFATFGFNINMVNDTARLPDGKMLAGGSFFATAPTGESFRHLMRLHADGTLDGSFIPDIPDNIVRELLLLPDGRILVGGNFRTFGTIYVRIGIGILHPDGKVDTTFNALLPANSQVHALVARPDGKIWVGGTFTAFAGNSAVKYLARLNADGTPDTDYRPPALTGYVASIHQNADGSLLLGGQSVSSRGSLTRLTPANTIDTTFPAGGNGPGAWRGYDSPFVTRILPGADGKFYIAGYFNLYSGVDRVGLVRILPNGELDTGFTPAAYPEGTTVHDLDYLGANILVSGQFSGYAGNLGRAHLALIDSTGALVNAPELPAAGGAIFHARVEQDNTIILGGDFPTMGGLTKDSLARLVEGGGGGGSSLAIVAQPQSVQAAAGARATLAVAATGQGSLSFQWSKEGEPLEGETHFALTFPAVSPEHAGSYTVQVRDSSGAILSAAAILTLEGEGSSGSAFSDWAVAHSIPAGLDGLTDDADGDGYSNAAEYAFGTDPMESGDAPVLDQRTVESAGQSYPAVSYVRNANAEGVAVQIRASTSVTFNPPAATVEESVEDLGNGLERVTVRSTAPLPTVSTFFFEVRTAASVN